MFEGLQDSKVIWRSRFNYAPIIGKKKVIYYEDVFLAFACTWLLTFVVATFLLWCIDVRIFVRPPNPTFIGDMPDFVNASPLPHLVAWCEFVLHSLPFHPFKAEVRQYQRMGDWLTAHGLFYVLGIRVLCAFTVACMAGAKLALGVISRPISSEVTVHKRGMQVLYGIEAVKAFTVQTYSELKKYGSFVEMSKGLFYSVYRVLTHTIGIGASGSGKSQFLEPHVRQAIKKGIKSVILDPKYEFTQALYDPNDPSMAILDPTDARSHVWDIPHDINTISKMRRFANAFIPASDGDNAMWGNAARQLFVGATLYLSKTFPDYTPRDITDMFSMLTPEQYYYIMKNYYPPGLDSVGMLDENGKIEENTTSYGVKMNLKGFVDGLVDLGRFWNNPKQKKISLYEFMTNPDYPIKTIFIKPNDNERLMSSGVIRSCLNFMISLLDSPDISDARKLRGIFFLDEFQAPGKLVTEDGTPTINILLDRGRSKGWGSYLFVQDILQLYNTYTEQQVEQWRVVASQFVLTGTPPGKTAQMVSDMIGKEYFDKVHTSYGFDQMTGKRKMGDLNIQEHESAVILPSEIAGYLKPTDEGNIRFLLLARGLKDAYIFEKPIVPLEQKEPAWVRQPEDTNLVNNKSRVINKLNEQMKPARAPAEEQPNNQSEQEEVDERLPVGEDYVEDIVEGFYDDDAPEIVLQDDRDELDKVYEKWK